MHKPCALFVLFVFLLYFSCSKKEEPQMLPDRPQTFSTAEKFAPLSDEQVTALLNNAKSTAGELDDYTQSLSPAEIAAILATVADTPVAQVKDNEVALLETTMGPIVIAFYSDIAPEHTRSFKRLVTSGYFDGTRFHRIIDTFMIQGGDILTRDENPNNDGAGGPGYNLPAEFNDIPHDLGIVSMARTQDPNSAGSQFFICLSRERTSALDGQYTVFGKVVGGLDIVQAIGKVPVRANRYGEVSVPVEPVYIKNAYIFTR